MLRWIRCQLSPETKPDDAVLWAALMTAFFFLMRIGEYAYSNGWAMDRVLTPADLRAQREGQQVELFSEADEVMLRFKKSKADQEGAGATRNHYRSGEELCPAEALAFLQRHFGHRMRSEPHLPLFRWRDGSPLTREQIQAPLERAAVAEGLPAERFRSHSLRIGGATTLYHIYHDVEIIKRYGRWASSAFQGYLWEANETAKGVSTKMATDVSTLHVNDGPAGVREPPPRQKVRFRVPGVDQQQSAADMKAEHEQKQRQPQPLANCVWPRWPG